MIWIILILLVLLLGFLLFVVIHNKITCDRLKEEFNRCNVIVYGKKGTGKDLLFQKVINLRKKEYHANISYGGNYHHIEMADLELKGNTYDNFIKGNINICQKPPYESQDIYFSDIGTIAPSQCDSTLHKTYPSFPITYALSRHLYANNIHCNCQNLGRVWKALREQADFYIKCRRKLSIGPFIISFITFYDKYESANNNILPMKVRFSNEDSRALADQFTATNGLIQNRFFIQLKKNISYDTRAYHRIVFGTDSPHPHKQVRPLKGIFLNNRVAKKKSRKTDNP